MFVNSFFDREDFDKNHKYYIDDYISFNIESEWTKTANLLLMISELELADELMSFG